MLDEQGQKIVDTLNTTEELSITIQVVEDATRMCYSIPSTTKLTDLAFWAAVMLDAQKTLMNLWHQHCVDLNVPTSAFDEEVARLLAKMQKLRQSPANALGYEAVSDKTAEEPDEKGDVPPEAEKRKPL